MNALCKACKNFTAAENSDKIRRVLRHQVKLMQVVSMTMETRFILREKTYEWKRSGAVMKKDRQQVNKKHSDDVNSSKNLNKDRNLTYTSVLEKM